MNNIHRGSGFISKVMTLYEGFIHTSYIAEASLYREVFNEQSQIIGFVSAVYSTYIEVVLLSKIKIELYDIVYISNNCISFSFNNNILGSVVNPLGEYISHFTLKENFHNNTLVNIFSEAPNISEREPICDQLITGHNVIDMLIPIGKGQRMMIIGPEKVYKTFNVTNVIKNILSNRKIVKYDLKTIFVYVSISKTNSHLKEVLDNMVGNVVGNTLIINAHPSDTIGMQFLAPYSGMAFAEYYAKQGYDMVVILDDLTAHAERCRELGLLSKKPYGRDYYPSEIFFRHSSLLERAYNGKNGSITILCITESKGDDITEYITTNIISITDGQLVFDSNMVKSQILPPISIKYSVSRVGLSAQSKIFSEIATQCNISLANYYDNVDFYNMYENNCDEEVIKSIYDGEYTLCMLYSISNNNVLDFVYQVIIATILKYKVGYNDFTIQTIRNGDMKNKINKTIVLSYNQIIKDSNIINKLEINVHDISVMEEINEIIKNNYYINE